MDESRVQAPLFSLAHRDVFVAQGVVFAFIAVCTLVGAVHPRLRRSAKIRSAIHGWWPVSLLSTLGNHFGVVAAAVVFGAVSCGLVIEGLRLLPLSAKARRAHVAVGVIVAVGTHAALVLGQPSLALALPVVAALAVVPVVQLASEGSADFVRRSGGVQWIILAGVLAFSGVTHLLTSTGVVGPYGAPGAGYVFFVVIMMFDAMQFTIGKIVGKTLLFPSLSPNKTVEGAVGGVVVAVVIAGVLFPVILDLPAWQGALVGLALGGLGLTGDVIVSGWKRDAGVKDSGALIPGQGGLLDRCDSILFAIPWYVAFVLWVGHP